MNTKLEKERRTSTIGQRSNSEEPAEESRYEERLDVRCECLAEMEERVAG